MSVRHSLLAILDQGSCYGYQARRKIERRTGATRPLNAGQVFNTLERLERDGLVTRGDADDDGHVYWRITPAGSAVARDWLAAPVTRGTADLAELAQKVALAASLPGVDVSSLLQAQREHVRGRLHALAAPPDGSDADLADALSRDAARLQADVELRWIEAAERRLAGRRPDAAQGLAADRPRRGRPSRADAAAAAVSAR